MKLMVSSFNIGSSWNGEEEETKLRTYTLNHSFNKPAECNIVLADTDGAMLRKYRTELKIDLDGGVADDGGVETDETTETNSAAANDMTLMPAVPQVNDAFYFGFSEEVGALTLNVGTAADPGVADDSTIAWEYSQGSDVWAALAGVTDDTDGFMNSGENNVEWTIPGAWDTDEVGSISGKYWVRARLSLYNGWDTIPIGTQAWYNKVWIGPGKITLEDPTATDVFYGRIKKVVGSSADRTATLECVDWLDQLDEELETYEMREKLGTTDLRQSTARMDKTDYLVASNVAGDFFFYDDGDYGTDGGMAFVNDSYNTMKVFFTTEMAGTRTWRFFVYKGVDAGDPPTYADNWDNTWTDDDSIHDRCFDGAGDDWTLVYTFRAEVGHNTPSDFYVHDSISKATLHIKYTLIHSIATGHTHLQIYDNNAVAYVTLHEMEHDDTQHADTLSIQLDILPYIVDATGEINVRFDTDVQGGTSDLFIYSCWIDVTTETTGYTSGVTINDTINPNKLEVATDLTAAATQVWEGIPYCIAKPIYLHLESATGIILGGDNIVTLTAGAGDIENTTGYSTRQYKNRTRLQILQDLARQDKSMFWMALGTTTVTYKQTFGANTQTMTDATPDSWQSLRDYNTIVNSYDVYGARIGDYEIFQQSQDSASIATYKATRSKVLKDQGLVSDANALDIGTALAARDANIEQMIGCTLSGFDTTYRLGTIVEITSSYLWASAAKDYIVSRWAYDSEARKTFLTMHPKVSIGLQDIVSPMTEGTMIKDDVDRSQKDSFVPDPVTHEVS